MKSRPNWHAAQPGVMLYMAAPRVSVADTDQSLSQLSCSGYEGSRGVQSQESKISDNVLPSCEVEPDVKVKIEPIELHDSVFSNDESPGTLAGDEMTESLVETISTALSTPESAANADFLAQLTTAAGEGVSSPETAVSNLTYHEEPLHVAEDVEYDSERTDFLESTPCPSPVRRTAKKRLSSLGKMGRHSRKKPQLFPTKPLSRVLSFGSPLKTQQPAKASKKSPHAQALADLRSLERAPSHKWDDDERELLCVLNRWYCSADRATELMVFCKTFNLITGLDLKPHIIGNQFKSHLRLYGAEAYPVYGRVFGVAFDDPEGRYAEVRALIEEEAQTLRLDLRRRQSDQQIASGEAKYAKSPRTRTIYRSLVRRASQEARRRASETVTTGRVSAVPANLMSVSKAVRMPPEDEWELVTDIDPSPEPVKQDAGPTTATTIRPHLTFRVWDATNRTKFVDGSFIAQTFVDWPRPFPAPIALDDPSSAGKILAFLHLNKQGDTPVFISTASSLLQALSYATNMEQPQIALIDLDAASLQAEHKLHHAAEVFPWLKAQGLALWARYKGHGEYFVFSDISSDAVIHTFDLEQLIDALDNCMDCRQLLSFDAFEPGAKTNTIAANLREKNAMLSTATARALGKIAKTFGMGRANVTLMHIQDFVARILDGWTITKADAIDIHSMSSLAATFATALGGHASGYTVQDIMGAFVAGVDQGTRCIVHWSRSRSGGRRQQFREV